MTKTTRSPDLAPKRRYALGLLALAPLVLTACETAGDGSYLPPSIIELIPPDITQEDIYSRPSTPDGVRCYLYQQTGIEVLVGCADVGILG